MKISEDTSVSMPIRNMAMIIAAVAMGVFDHLHFVVSIEKTCLRNSKFPSIEKQYMNYYLLAVKYVCRSNKMP